jgi:hypothetical protein
MAFPTVSDTAFETVSSPSAGTHVRTYGMTIGANSQGVVVAVTVASGTAALPAATAVSIGGLAFTLQEDTGAADNRRTQLWRRTSLSGRSNDTVTVNLTAGSHWYNVGVYVLDHADPISVIDSDTAQGDGSADVTLAAGAVECMGIIAASGGGGNLTAGSGQTADWNTAFFTLYDSAGSHEQVAGTEVLSYSSSSNIWAAGIILGAVLPITVDVDASVVVEWEVPAGLTVDTGPDVKVLVGQPARVLWAVPSDIAVTSRGSRQVMLTGDDLETTEMTEDGTEGQVLTYHEGDKPTWEDPTGGGGGGDIMVRETDGTPEVDPTSELEFDPGFIVTDQGGGVARVTPDWAESGDLSTQAFGDSAAAGTSAEVPRADHKHGMMANPVTAHEAAGDPHPGYALDTDLSSHAAAADPHTGYLKESDVSGGGTPALTLGTSNAAGSATTVVRTDATIAAFDATAPTTQAFGDSAATGAAAVAARRDHKHGMPASPVDFGEDADIVQIDYADAAAAGATGEVADAGHQHAVNAKFQHAAMIFEFGPAAAVNDYHLIQIPFDFNPTDWSIMGDVSGSCSVDLWMDTFANGQPTNADSITASATPGVTTALSNSSSSLTGWDTSWVKGDMLKVVIESLTTMTQLTLTVNGLKT